GQGHELNVAWDGGKTLDLLEGFHALHQRRYGHSSHHRPVQLVTLRFRARLPRDPVPDVQLGAGTADPSGALANTRRVYLGSWEDVPVYNRGRLLAGNVIPGPAIVEQEDSTTLVSKGWTAEVHESGTLVITRGD